MKIIYSNEGISVETPSLFLAGPTPRDSHTPSWRPKALNILSYDLDYKGTVYVPEWKNGLAQISYIDQVEWEYAHLTECTTIVFWIPRQLDVMPSFTTNVEFGTYINSGRILYGRPDWAAKCDYLDWLYTKVTGKKPHVSIEELLAEAVGGQK